METPYTVTDEMAEMLMPGVDEIVKGHILQVEMTKAKYLEQMAANFILETGVPATHCVLVQEQLPHPQYGWRFYYRLRDQ